MTLIWLVILQVVQVILWTHGRKGIINLKSKVIKIGLLRSPRMLAHIILCLSDCLRLMIELARITLFNSMGKTLP
jgi:hypothetical protein